MAPSPFPLCIKSFNFSTFPPSDPFGFALRISVFVTSTTCSSSDWLGLCGISFSWAKTAGSSPGRVPDRFADRFLLVSRLVSWGSLHASSIGLWQRNTTRLSSWICFEKSLRKLYAHRLALCQSVQKVLEEHCLGQCHCKQSAHDSMQHMFDSAENLILTWSVWEDALSKYELWQLDHHVLVTFKGPNWTYNFI